MALTHAPSLAGADPTAIQVPGHFGWIDGWVVLGILGLITWVGHRMSPPQKSARDFFLGGRSLPWYAVAASIIATELSAVTFVSLPSVVFKPGGNLTYLQIGLFGSLVARWSIARWLVPVYLRSEIYSPYEFVGQRLGAAAKAWVTALFTLGGILGQAARVYMTALALEILLPGPLAALGGRLGVEPLSAAVILLGTVALLWTWMGGMATVIWTDALLFLLFVFGGLVLIGFGVAGYGEGPLTLMREASSQGKLQLLDFDTDPTKAFTFWAAAFACAWGGIGQYGTDQLMAQRLFCCRSERDAQRAIRASYLAVLVIALIAMVGVALYGYYRTHPMGELSQALFDEKNDRILLLFVREALPVGVRGFVVAGVLAAAISSLDSILAALSQTTVSSLWLPWRERRGLGSEDALVVRASRVFVLAWCIVLCAVAILTETLAEQHGSVLSWALAASGICGGALLGAVVLALRATPGTPGRTGARGFPWSAPLSVLLVASIQFHGSFAQRWVPWVLGACALLWFTKRMGGGAGPRGWGRADFVYLGLLALVYVVLRRLHFEGGASLAWPWYIPIGSTVAVLGALALDGGAGEDVATGDEGPVRSTH